MHVPYSMDETELDLVAPWGSHDLPEADDWPASPLPKLYTQHEVDDLVAEAVRKLIGKHQESINVYRKEIIEMYMKYEHGGFYDN